MKFSIFTIILNSRRKENREYTQNLYSSRKFSFLFMFDLQLSFLSFLQWLLWLLEFLLNAKENEFFICYMRKNAWLVSKTEVERNEHWASGKRDEMPRNSSNINLMMYLSSSSSRTIFLSLLHTKKTAPKTSFDPFDTCFDEKWLW